jgi:hypothetical protein
MAAEPTPAPTTEEPAPEAAVDDLSPQATGHARVNRFRVARSRLEERVINTIDLIGERPFSV